MKRILLLVLSLAALQTANAQGTFCDPNGNLVIISNYDGGIMNINVDVSIPNLKIGIVTYEAVQINLSGTGLSSLTAIEYAGYNGNNDNCGTGVTNTTITGVPGGATSNIVIYPPTTLPNPNGWNGGIVCGYSCDINSNQGGCNTADQIEHYFLQLFPGSSLRFHGIQYNCIPVPINISGGGNCCAGASPLTASITSTNPSCPELCDGSAVAAATGGQPPYTYQWVGGPASDGYSGLCAGVYTVQIADGGGGILTQQVTIVAPPAITGTISSTPDNGTCNGSLTVSATGGNGGPYTYLWGTCGGNATTATVMGVCTGTCCVTITDNNGCTDSLCKPVGSTIGINELLSEYNSTLYPNPSEDGMFMISSPTGKLNEMRVRVIDVAGRNIDYLYTIKSSAYAQLQINATAGLYYVVFETPFGVYSHKAIRK